MSIEAMKHYEAALMAAFPYGAVGKVSEHWNKARQAIEQVEKQEPYGWVYEWSGKKHFTFTDQRFVEQAHPHFNKSIPVYTAPQPQREWVGLTPYQFDQLEQLFGHTVPNDFVLADIVCTVESKLKGNNQ